MAEPCSAGAGPRADGSSPSATSAPSGKPSRTKPYGFPKSKRLLKRAEFRRVYDHGRRTGNPLFTVFVLAREDGGGPRAGLTIPRAVGNAVERNRIRRRMREVLRLTLGNAGAPVDMIFHPRRSVLEADLADLRGRVEQVLARCGT